MLTPDQLASSVGLGANHTEPSDGHTRNSQRRSPRAAWSPAPSPVPHETPGVGRSEQDHVALPGEVEEGRAETSAEGDSNLLQREITSNKRTLSSRVTPAEIHSETSASQQEAYSTNEARGNLDNIAQLGLESAGSNGNVGSSLRRGDLSPHRQWINGIWYASQEVERRREQQASELFEEKKKAESLRDMGNLVAEVRRQGGIPENPTTNIGRFLKWLRTTRNSKSVHSLDAICSCILVFGFDIYAISSSSSTGDDAVQGVCLAFLGLLTLLWAIECAFNRDRSAPPYLFLELLSLLSFIPAVTWWLTNFRIKTNDDLWRTKVFLGCARAGKIIRLAVTFPRIYLWQLDLMAKSEEAHFAAQTVKAHEHRRNSLMTSMREKDFASFSRKESRLSWDSSESRTDSGPSQQERSHISLIMNRQMIHHSVLFVCLFYGMLAGYEVLGYENHMRDVEAAMRTLQKVHDKINMDGGEMFLEVSELGLDRLEGKGFRATYLELNGEFIFGDATEIDAFRSSPPTVIEYTLPKEEGVGRCEVHFDLTEFTRKDLGSSLYLSFMSLLVIFGTTAMMHKTLQTDVIRPMERMIGVIAQLAQEPLSPVRKMVEMRELSSTFETKMVEMAIYKFASLLQLAFGEAGAGIIRDNSSGGVLNQNMTGKVVHGIFGFCDVRNFTTLTEILQGDVVKIVNGIADVVHAAVCDNFGAPNKNVGDAFLLVWKPKGEQKVSHVAEAALRSYVRTIIQMSHSQLLEDFSGDEDVRRELVRRMPDLRLRLGFGLHYGWAVECAIGSDKKIDASYLSPHVNLSSRLEAGTKQYGVDILISAHVYQLFGPEVQELCRLVDRVTFKGSDQPISIYTYDVPDGKTAIDPSVAPLEHRMMSAKSLDRSKTWEDTELHLQNFFRSYPPAIDNQFRSLFAQAMMFYLGGPDGDAADWERAQGLFRKCLEKRPTDGPSATLLAFLEGKSGKAGSPGQGWRGFRHLDEK